jgi:hypothetical protein
MKYSKKEIEKYIKKHPQLLKDLKPELLEEFIGYIKEIDRKREKTYS